MKSNPSATGKSRTRAAAKNRPRTKSQTESSPIPVEHGAAVSAGRQETRAVREYLEALDAYRPRPGRKPTPETIERRIAAIDVELGVAARAKRAGLVQERLHLAEQLRSVKAANDLQGLEANFLKNARRYSERKGLTYAAWREVGVSPQVLRQAGIRDAAT